MRHAGRATNYVLNWWTESSRLRGFDTALMTQLHTLMIDTGLINVEKKIITVPLGKWGGRTGIAMAQNLSQIFVHLKTFYCSTLNLNADHYDQTVMQLLDEWELQQTSYDFYIYYGQKKK